MASCLSWFDKEMHVKKLRMDYNNNHSWWYLIKSFQFSIKLKFTTTIMVKKCTARKKWTKKLDGIGFVWEQKTSSPYVCTCETVSRVVVPVPVAVMVPSSTLCCSLTKTEVISPLTKNHLLPVTHMQMIHTLGISWGKIWCPHHFTIHTPPPYSLSVTKTKHLMSLSILLWVLSGKLHSSRTSSILLFQE